MLFTLPDRAALPDDVESLKDLVLEVMRRASIAAQEASHSIERLELQLVALRRVVFGVRSERLACQADLFALTSALRMPPTLKDRVTYARNRRGRPALPADLPRPRVQYDLDEAEKALFARVPPTGEQVSGCP